MNYLYLSGLLFFITLSSGLSSRTAYSETLGFSVSDPTPLGSTSAVKVTVYDDTSQLPVSGAHLVFQTSFSDPAELQGDSNEQGIWNTHPYKFNAPKTLTVSKKGYVTLSVAGILNKKIQIYLKPASDSSMTVLASGSVQDWKTPELGKLIYAGVVFPNINAYDFFRFNASLFVSPLRDVIDVYGPRNIPSNLTFPAQDINVIVGKVHLDKPDYRLPVLSNRSVKLIGLQGQLQVRDALSIITGGGSGANLDLINQLKITHLGMTDTIQTSQDFKMNAQLSIPLKPKFKVTVNPPPFRSDVFVAAISDLDGNRKTLVPTDIKVPVFAAKPGEVKSVDLNSSENKLGKSEHILTVAVSKNPKIATGILTNDPNGDLIKPGEYLPFYPLNTVTNPKDDYYEIQAPTRGIGALVFDTTQPVWMVYALPAAQKVKVPKKLAIDQFQAATTSTVQLEFGSQFNPGEIDGVRVIEKLSRFAASIHNLQELLPEAQPSVTIEEDASILQP